MQRIVRLNNNRGFTLVEVLVAMVIILVLFLGLVQAALLSIDSNLRNLLRDEAVRIAEQRINELRNIPFDSLVVGGPNCLTVSKDFRSLQKLYNVCDIIVTLDPNTNTRSLQVVVGWNHKNENPLQVPTNREFQHSISSIVRRPL
jgi:type IV pilus assembly protein PilV